jgi:hypothetical protein
MCAPGDMIVNPNLVRFIGTVTVNAKDTPLSYPHVEIPREEYRTTQPLYYLYVKLR